MPPEHAQTVSRPLAIDWPRLWPRVVMGLWVIVVVVCCLRASLSSRQRSVYPIFAAAAQHWLAGAEVYVTGDAPYRYSPLVTVLLTPFGLLPYPPGVVLWQLLNVAVLLAGLTAWCRHVLPRDLGAAARRCSSC